MIKIATTISSSRSQSNLHSREGSELGNNKFDNTLRQKQDLDNSSNALLSNLRREVHNQIKTGSKFYQIYRNSYIDNLFHRMDFSAQDHKSS